MEEIWIEIHDIMTVAKIYGLTYTDAVDKIRQDVEAQGKRAHFQ